jgi:O-antigen/teichoic acid export membrane protein
MNGVLKALMHSEGRVDKGSRKSYEMKAGAVLSYALIGLQLVVAIIYTPLMLRLLGQAEYGIYSLVASIVGSLSVLSFGLGGSYMRFYARFRVVEDWDGVRRLNGMFLVMFTAIGFIAALGGTFLAFNVAAVLGGQFSNGELETARVLFVILVVNLTITFPLIVFNSYVISQERFVFQKLLQIAGTIVSPLVVLPVLLLGYRSIGMAVAATAVNIALTVRTLTYCRSNLEMQFSFRGFDFGLLREVAVFSGYVFILTLVDQVNWNVDKFIIGRFRGATAVAIYGVAALFNVYYISFSLAISSVFIPRINRMVASSYSDKEISQLFTRVGRVQFLVLGLVVSGFVFFGRPFIDVWAGRNYGEAYVIAILLMAPATVDLIQNLGIEIQKSKNLVKFRSWVYLAVAAGNILLSIPLTQRYGGIGAAAGTGIALVIANGFIMNWYYQARVGLDIKDFWRQIVRVSLGMVPAVIGGAIVSCTIDLHSISMLLLLGGAYVVVYAAGAWWLGMNEYERHLFGSPIKRLVARRSRA